MSSASLSGGHSLVDYGFSREVEEDQLYWPLKGEYWRDELGTYLYTLTRGCAQHRAGAPLATSAFR